MSKEYTLSIILPSNYMIQSEVFYKVQNDSIRKLNVVLNGTNLYKHEDIDMTNDNYFITALKGLVENQPHADIITF